MKKSRGLIILLVFFLALAGVTYIDFKGIDGKGSQAASDITLGLDLAGGVSITYQVVGEEEPDQTDMSDTIDKLRQRVFEYNSEALVYQEGSDRISIEIPGVTDANAILEDLGKPGELYFIYQLGSDGTENYTGAYVMNEAGEVEVQYELLKPIEDIVADGSVALYGTDVADARGASMRDDIGNQYFGVDLLMTEEGKEKFTLSTTRSAATGETLSIY